MRSSRDLQREAVVEQRLTERGLPVVPTEVLEARRTQYLRILTNLHEVSEIYGAGARSQDGLSQQGVRSTAAKTMGMVQDLSHAELTLMMDTVPDLSPLLQATENLSQIARKERMQQLRNSGLGSGSDSGGSFNSAGFPNASYSVEVGSTRPTTTALLAASAVFEVADDTRELAGRACDETIVAIGAGGNTALVCLISDGIWVVAKSVFWGIQFESDDVDSAEILGSYNRLGHLHTDIEGLQTSINTHDINIDTDLSNHDTNIDTDLSNHDTNIDTDLANHDANIDADLVAHDTNIDADLVAHDMHLAVHDVAVQARLGAVQGTLDNEVEQRQVHLSVFQVVMRRTYMIVATESGAAVDVAFNAIQVYDEGSRTFLNLGAANVTQVDTGIYVVDLNLPAQSPSSIFRVKVRHDDVVDHFGEIVFHRTAGTL